MTRYEHTQIGHTIIWCMVGVAILVAIIGIFAPAGREVLLITDVILLICAAVFCKLTIKVDSETVRACFGTKFICKKVPVAEIAECEPMRIQWWYGWGIHLVPMPYGWGWLYNVNGWDAVAIKLRDGRTFALGTDDPDGLVAAIQSCIS